MEIKFHTEVESSFCHFVNASQSVYYYCCWKRWQEYNTKALHMI